MFRRILNQVPDLIELTGYYRCPGDGGQLSPKAQGLACVLCNRRFPLQTQGIIDFDIVKSDQRMAFDEQQRGKRVLSTAETEASRTVADRFLTTAGLLRGTLENILDLACGTGQVTVGLYLHEHIRHCKIFGFDHSLQSLQVLANTLSNLSSTNFA